MPLSRINISKTTNGWLVQPQFTRIPEITNTVNDWYDEGVHVNRNDLAFVFNSSAGLIEWLIPTVTEEGRNLFPRTSEGVSTND